MKNIFIAILILFSNVVFSQITIGKSTPTSTAVSLEFGDENRGLLLPWVTNVSVVESPENGTMSYDSQDKKVKVKLANGWKDLTVNTTGTTIDPITQVDGLTIQSSSVNEQVDAKVYIGELTATKGILVLEDKNKAMVLPKVYQPHLNIINPSPGMIVFDTKDNLLCVFNGKDWAFWKPQEW
ncbi:hypothetical protein [Faecalibacter bovis]|uniref:Uncharacterized protein n=1 Tax=Faecalibacter bovis TaxID=2898187 RepID=A0ABX7XDD5_9FLAO|nr:hypothetical protein [Faecalibacter bovis]QTV05941.1 hypothetical protein J9309_00910 [Faecalibacter bovis]